MRSQATGASVVAASPAVSSAAVMASLLACGMYCHMMEWESTQTWSGRRLPSSRWTNSAASPRSSL